MDWIGVYSPSNVDPKQTSVIKYKPTLSSASSGSTTWRLLNMRADCECFLSLLHNVVLLCWS
jgi:hypothetical protein